MKQFVAWVASICGIFLAPTVSFALGWMEEPGPAATISESSIYGMTVVSESDVWAVGDIVNKPLVEHWDGTSWVVVPNAGTPLGGFLRAVAARSSRDVWAVGDTGDEQTLIEHWNGNKWLVVPSPSIGTWDFLQGVCVISRNDAWAVGYSLSPVVRYILMHWDGTSWSLVSGPPITAGALFSLKAFASDDVWAVGSKDYFGNNPTTLTLHWDGTTWSEIPSPNVEEGSYLGGVDGTAPNNVWAVGESTVGFDIIHTLAMYWDGTAWTVVPTPVIHSEEGFYAVKVFSPTNVIVVGTSSSAPLSEHWDGTQWSVIPTPPADPGSILFAISGRDGAVWAAGYQNYFGRKLDELFLRAIP
jgi:hypothetical protein